MVDVVGVNGPARPPLSTACRRRSNPNCQRQHRLQAGYQSDGVLGRGALVSGNAEADDRYAIPSLERAGEADRMERIRDRMGMSSLLIYSMFAELRELKIRGSYAGLLAVLGGKVVAPRIDFAP